MFERYRQNIPLFGKNYELGGNFIVPNPFDGSYYEHPAFFDIVDRGMSVDFYSKFLKDE